MPARRRPLLVIVLAALLAGCGVAPTPLVSPTPTGAPTAGTVSPGAAASAPATPAATPTPLVPSVSPSALPTPSPTDTPRVSPPPLGTGGFTTPIPADPAAAWTGIRWRKLAATDPLAHVRSVTRWAGGFVATGDLVATGTSARARVWVSADGGTWELLGADVFGPAAIVVGMGAIAGGVVAFTVQSGTNLYADDASRSPTDLSSWSLEGPWQSWTSTDGRTWTAHPGPGFTVPRSMMGDGGYPTLLAGAGNDLLALTLDNQPLAFTRDGVTWETASLNAFPGGPAGWKASAIVAFPPGFVSVGDSPTGPAALASADGRAWTSSALPASCPVGALTAGPAGLILAGYEGDYHSPTAVWCSSLDGRSWRRLAGYAPLGEGAVGYCRGVCPDGMLLGNGERMVAYHDPSQAGWASFDGRSWRPLPFSGSRPTGWSEPFGYQFNQILTPIGLLFVKTDDGSAWLGTPTT